MSDRDLAVLVPTLGRPALAADVVADVLAQGERVAEVVVVDQSEEEAAAALGAWIARLGDGRVRHLRAAPRGLPAARNAALAASRAPWVVFFDDDVRLLPGCLAAHAEALARPGVGAVAGRIVDRAVRPNQRRTGNRVGWSGRVRTNLAGFDAREVHTAQGANMAFRRAVLDAAGGFDPRYRGTALLEEADACARVRRLGHAVWFEPRAEVIHLSAPSGGVRQPDLRAAERWRFHNTGLYARQHLPRGAALPVGATFAAIAARRAAEWRDPGAIPDLLGALWRGWRDAR